MSRSLLFTAALITSSLGWAQVHDSNAAGVYCLTAAGPVWLSRLPMPSMSTQNFGEWVIGDHGFKLRYTWEGASSHAQISEHRPTFKINLDYHPDQELQQIQIVKLERKSASRKIGLQFSPTEFQNGVAVNLTRATDGQLLVRPEADLSPGEYMLSLGPLAMQYDFTVL